MSRQNEIKYCIFSLSLSLSLCLFKKDPSLLACNAKRMYELINKYYEKGVDSFG